MPERISLIILSTKLTASAGWQFSKDYSREPPYINKPTEFTHSELAKSKFDIIKEKFRCDEPSWAFSQLHIEDKASVVNSVSLERDVKSGLLESKKYYECGLDTHPRFDEMLTRFARLFCDLSGSELEFLNFFVL